MSLLKYPVNPDDHALGPENALVNLVEYGDYQCLHCKEGSRIARRLQSELNGQIRFVFRHFPLTEVHPFAELAAKTAEFAAAHDRFWEMHTLLFENQDRFSLPLFLTLGASLNLSEQELKHALTHKAFEEKIKKDFMSGVRSGVNGTPTFFINNERYNGAIELNPLLEAIRAAANTNLP